MITIEKDTKAEEIFIHAAPEDLRGFAKKALADVRKSRGQGQASRGRSFAAGLATENGPSRRFVISSDWRMLWY